MALSKCPGCAAALPDDSHFCHNCGRPLGERERPRQLDPGGGWVEFVDRSWDFFASTKVAAYLIVLIAIASIAGSLIEQESLYQDWRPPAMYYPVRYGEFWGKLYMATGLTHAYSSIWYASLILLCVISLIICSLQRLIPLHKMLVNPQVSKPGYFIRRQHVVAEDEGTLEQVASTLRRGGYKILGNQESLYGDKGRISRYGPYIIHIGLLVVAFAAFAKALPGWDLTRDVWIPDGQTVKVPDTDFAITNHKFTMELYPNGMPSRFATDAAVVQNGAEMARKVIEVNQPMLYGGWEIYQASFRQEPGTAHLRVITADDGSAVADIALDLRQPEQEYPVGDRLKLAIKAYYHDFVVDEETQSGTNASFEIRNPVLLGEFLTADTGRLVGRVGLAVFGEEPPVFEGPLSLKVDRVETRWFTALKLHKDLTTPYMYTGLAIVMLGMVITFFLFHWQVWAREENGKVLVGGRAYKNKFGLKQEFRRLFGAPDGEEFET